jgi:signal transduction histidine kinase
MAAACFPARASGPRGISVRTGALVGIAWVLSMAWTLKRLPAPMGHSLLDYTTVLANAVTVLACLDRARRFPQEQSGWWLLGVTAGLGALGQILFSLFRGDLVRVEMIGTWLIALHLAMALTMVWGVLRLSPLLPGPPGIWIRIQGALLFSTSLALLLWVLGIWHLPGAYARLEEALLAANSLRISLVGGMIGYLFMEDPRRARGPLGLMLLAILLGGGSVIEAYRIHLLDPQHSFSLIQAGTLLWPVGLTLSSLLDSPVEDTTTREMKPLSARVVIMYLPYLGSAIWLLLAEARFPAQTRAPLGWFLVVTTLLIVHQFTLHRQHWRARGDLKTLLMERSRSLETTTELLFRTERLRGIVSVAAGLVHDFNNNITVMMSSVDLMRDSLKRGAPVRETDLDRIEASSRYCGSLTKRLMAFARRDLAKEEWQDLRITLSECAELLKLVTRDQVELAVSLPAEPIYVLATKGIIEQILINLVGNANDAITGVGRVEVELGLSAFGNGNPAACLHVSDCGSGMSREVMAQLFQPMFSTKAQHQGTGLGLYCVKAMVESLGGDISVRSTVGLGSTFTIRLPMGSMEESVAKQGH